MGFTHPRYRVVGDSEFAVKGVKRPFMAELVGQRQFEIDLCQ